MNDLSNAPVSPAYARLVARAGRVAALHEAAGLLSWDAQAMMPRGGAQARGEQMAALAGVAHAMATAPEVADDLAEAEQAPPADPWHAANLRLLRHHHARTVAVPADLVEAMTTANAACEAVWRDARAAADFDLVRPRLAEVLGLVRQQAQALSAALGLSPYDALMDGFQPGLRADEVAPVFDRYAAFLADALPRAEDLQASRPGAIQPAGPFSEAAQEALCRTLAAHVGLEPDHFRLDRSAHPFCGGSPTDVRITTRYDTDDFARALMGVLHESGHALYERGLPPAFARQPVGMACGMAVHESQSLIVELQACRSDAFLCWLSPQLHAAFGGDAAAYAPDNMARLLRRVGRTFIRVDADEMTYPMHVILRFQLEQAMIAGTLGVEDLPDAWNEGMRELLGIVPPDDAAGCLQDIHWYDGLWGYFPAYSLGAMAAAQLMDAARTAEPGLDAALARGDLSPLLGWLRTHVHGRGSLLGWNDLLREATGRPLDPAPFTEHLTRRYLA